MAPLAPSCGPNTALNTASGQCEIECDGGERRLENTDDDETLAAQQIVSALLERHLADHRAEPYSGEQERMARFAQHFGRDLVHQLFGLPALA